MNWLHTWTGVVIGALLFAIFWMGTLAVFDREIDRWMMPMTRVSAAGAVSLDRIAPEIDRRAREAGSPQWYITLPTERTPTLQVGYRDRDRSTRRWHADPAAGEVLPDPATLGGTGFIFPFHFNLHLRVWDLGYWLVGLAAMAMLALIVSGVVIHRHIFVDFFLLRIGKAPRTALDLHNVTGVLALPFHFIITLSGLIIFIFVYWPAAWGPAYGSGERRTVTEDVFGRFSRPAEAKPGGILASLDQLAAHAAGLWGGTAPSFVRVWHPGDAASYVEIRRSSQDSITLPVNAAYFDAATGALLHHHEMSPMVGAQRFIAGLHFIQFRHWTLRWLYFALGLVGCVLISTGFLFWLEGRRKRHARLGLSGVRIVEGLTVGSVTGIILATLAFFVANRVLPLPMADRSSVEFWTFYVVWLAAFGHAWARPCRQAWSEQLWVIAGLALLAVMMNAATTGDHLIRSLAHRHLWAVAGVDLVILAGGVIAAQAAWALARRQLGPPVAVSADRAAAE